MKRQEVFNTAAIATATAASLVSCSQAGKSPSVQAGLPNISSRIGNNFTSYPANPNRVLIFTQNIINL
ncbi:hypothetical protein [Nostoc sp.]